MARWIIWRIKRKNWADQLYLSLIKYVYTVNMISLHMPVSLYAVSSYTESIIRYSALLIVLCELIGGLLSNNRPYTSISLYPIAQNGSYQRTLLYTTIIEIPYDCS